MFQPGLERFTLVDPERGYSLRSLGSRDRGEIFMAAVTIGGIEIPLEYRIDHQLDDSGTWYDLSITAVGRSIVSEIQSGLVTATFDSDEEREAAVMVAVEALLAYKTIGFTPERGDGYNRTTVKGVQYRLSDFGPYFV